MQQTFQVAMRPATATTIGLAMMVILQGHQQLQCWHRAPTNFQPGELILLMEGNSTPTQGLQQ